MSWVIDNQALHITVGSYPNSRIVEGVRRIDIQTDLAMVKAALLYADHVRLCSLTSSLLLEIVALTDIPAHRQWEFLETLHSWGMIDEDFAETIESVRASYDYARRRRHSRRGKALLQKFDRELEEVWSQTVQNTEQFVSGLGLEGITEAKGTGLLEVYTFESQLKRIAQSTGDLDSLSTDFVFEYIDVVGTAVSDARTYPLFDENTGDLISAGIAARKIPVSDSSMNRSKEVSLASDLFARLPLFPHASIKEILDIRKELERPLQSFRSAMIEFSNEIKSAGWDKDFVFDAERVFRQKVATAVLRLEQEVESNSYLATLVSEIADKPYQLVGGAAGGSALSTLAVRMLNLPLSDVAALALAPLLTVGGVLLKAYKSWQAERDEIQQNNLFFYYKAGAFLEERTYEYKR